MSVRPPNLIALADYLTGQGVAVLGIVGDQRHCSGYHLGRDRIYSDCACKPDGTCRAGRGDADYSVQRPRDRAGLTNYASAIDLGRIDGSLPGLQAFSRWLVARCVEGFDPGRAIREVIYSPDGTAVRCWDDEQGFVVRGDNSHGTHTHVSLYRDARARDLVALIRPYFEPEDDMTPAPITSEAPARIDVPLGASFFDLDGTTKLGAFTYAGFVGRDSPYGVGELRAMYAAVPLSGGPRRVVLVKPSKITLLGDVVAAATAAGVVTGRRQIKAAVAALPNTP